MSFGGFLKADTERIVIVGPFVDVGDGFTPQTDITLGGDEAELLKHGSSSVVDISGNTWAAVTNCRGYYALTLTASNLDTEGMLKVIIQDDSDCLPVEMSYMVVNANVFDSLFAAATTDYLQVDVLQIAGVAQSLTDLKDFADTGYDPSTHKVQGVLLTDTCTTNSDMRGTDSAALANVVGALADAAADGDPTEADTVMKYVKQLVNVLVGSAGIVAFPAEQAPANAINLAEVMRAIHVDVTGLNGDAMRGTDNANTTVPDAAGTAASLHATTDGKIDVIDSIVDAIQDSVANITNVGAATNREASSYTLTTGTQSANAYTDTVALDGTKHTHTDAAGVMDLYYEFAIGGGTPASITVTGALTGINDDLEVHGYDWINTTWIQIGALAGKVSADNEVHSYMLFTSMVGTGDDFGKVRIRFTDGAYTLSTATLYIDQIFVSFAQGTGDYAFGAIWIDTNNANESTIPGIDGISTHPVSTWAAAKTLSAKLNIKTFYIVNGSSIIMDANCDNFTFIGKDYALALGGQSFENTHIAEANITGIGTAGSGKMHFIGCYFSTCTLGKTHAVNCMLEDGVTITLSAAETYTFVRCGAEGDTTPPIMDFNDVAAIVGFRDYNGGITTKNIAAGSKFTLQGKAHLHIDSTCDAGGTIGIHGNTILTDNVSGGFGGTLNDDARIDVGQINAECDSALADYDPPTRAELTTDKESIIAEIDSNETKIDTLTTNVSSLNNLSSANVEAACGTALTTYDPPTKTEMDNAHALLATEAKQDIIDTNVDQLETAIITNAAGVDIAADIIALKAVADTIAGDVVNLDGEAMRGTDNANITTPPTAAEIINEFESQSQADPTGFHVNVKEVNDVAQTANDNGADINTLLTHAIAIKAKTDNLPTGAAKSVQLNYVKFVMFDETDHITPKTGLTVTGQISKDNGVFAGISGTITEISNGWYYIDALSATEMNADSVSLKFTADGADQTNIEIRTDA